MARKRGQMLETAPSPFAEASSKQGEQLHCFYHKDF